MLERARQKLEKELLALEREFRHELPKEIHRALQMGDLRENAEYQSALERQHFVKSRITQLQEQLKNLAMIDLNALPKDRAGLGSTVTVLDAGAPGAGQGFQRAPGAPGQNFPGGPRPCQSSPRRARSMRTSSLRNLLAACFVSLAMAIPLHHAQANVIFGFVCTNPANCDGDSALRVEFIFTDAVLALGGQSITAANPAFVGWSIASSVGDGFSGTGATFGVSHNTQVQFSFSLGTSALSAIANTSGFFLPVANYSRNDLWNLRGNPAMFYYVMLALTVAAFVLCHLLMRSRMGYYWLAIREDEVAARSLGINTFRYKMYAVIISAGMTAVAGVFFAFYYNNLFPEQVFHISRSIELILGPIIGGIGTLFGPLVGAFLLTGLSETMQEILTALGLDAPGAKQVFYGLCLLVVVLALPDGVWPWLAGKLGVAGRRA